MVKIITVHGTFAGDSADSGEKWWQKGSVFLQKLQSCIKEPLDILPFHWSGDNSELDRRKTGNRLWGHIKSCSEPPILIGHSHGGSSSIHAAGDAILAGKTKADGKIKGLVTIATPMFRFRTNRNPIARFNIAGRITALVALSTVLLSISALTWEAEQAYRQGMPLSLMEFFKLVITNNGFWLAAIISVILWIYSRKNERRSKLYAKNGVWANLKNKILSFSHTQDEAIGALQQAQKVTPKLVTRTSIIAPFFGVVAFLLVLLDLGSEVVQTIADDDHYFTETEGTTASRPLVFISDSIVSHDAALRIRPQVTNLAEWRLFDIVGASKIRTREPLKAVMFDELWLDEGINDLLSTDNGVWLGKIRAESSNNLALAYVPLDQVEPFKKAFDATLAYAAEIGEEEFLTSTAVYEGDSLEIDEGALQRLFYLAASYDRAYGEQSEIKMPAAIIASVPLSADTYSDYSGYMAEQDWLPADTQFLASIMGSLYFHAYCSDEPDIANEVGGLCTLFYDPGQIILKYAVWDFTEYKYYLFDLLNFLGASDSAETLDALQSSNVEGIGLAVRVFLAVAVAVIFSVLVGFILAPLLNTFVVGTLRGNAYGNDGFGETLRDVHPGANLNGGRPGNLPFEVEEEMIANSLADAPEALQRLRSLFGVAELASKDGHDPVALATKFEKSELLHNAYFHSDKFIKFLAAEMIVKFGLTATKDLEEDEDGSRYLAAARGSL